MYSKIKAPARRVYLVGLMGSGKTTLARKLAQQLDGWLYFDTDEYIVSREKMSIGEIVAEKGWVYFREMERQALQASSYLKNCIIATGGGLPCFGDNMEIINNQGLSIYLNPPLGLIYERLSQLEQAEIRPLWQAQQVAERWAFLGRMYWERREVYERAHWEWDSSLGVERLVRGLRRQFE